MGAQNFVESAHAVHIVPCLMASSSSIALEYETLEVIGKGSFGTVRKVRQKSDGKILVRKEIEYTLMNSHERNQIISELRILRELDHPNIVSYLRHDHIVDQKMIHIYMEFCDGGDLAQVVLKFRRNKENVPEEFIWQVLMQTLLALHRCHYGIEAQKVNLYGGQRVSEPTINSETVVIHRDIKPDNIFLHDNESCIKVGDFGLAKMLTSRNDFAKTYVGTPYYMSPEVLMDEPYSPVCDIWSLGCVLYELCALVPPFQAKTHFQLQERIRLGLIPELPDCYSPHLRSIIKDCITVDTKARPSCYKLLETLSVRFLRKEMELKSLEGKLNSYLAQLVKKSEELKRREATVLTRIKDFDTKQHEWEEDFKSAQKNWSAHSKNLERELLQEFELRKRAIQQEAEEVRLGYQREFKMVVEKEVQQRLKELQRRNYSAHSEPSTPKKPGDIAAPLSQLALGHRHLNMQHSPGFSPNTGPKGTDLLPLKSRTSRDVVGSPQRLPLKNRNHDEAYHDQTPNKNLPRRRLTDALEKLGTDKRHVPEFEDFYLRANNRYQ